jgi:hypothetical protein
MHRTIVCVLVALFTPVASLHAACKTEACKDAVSWKNGHTAIVLKSDISRADYFAVLEAVRASGGAVGIEAERVLLGWLPRAAAPKLRSTRGVRTVVYDAVPRASELVTNEEALYALGFFNRVVTGEFEDQIEAGLAVKGQPLKGCLVSRSGRDASAEDADASATTIPRVFARSAPGIDALAPASHPRKPAAGPVAPNFWFNTPYQNPDMRGRVTVQLFRLDSNGAIDPNQYTWTTADFLYARDQVYGAFDFWANQAFARGIPLSFRVYVADPMSHYTRTYVPTPTRYEPITHGWSDDYLWVNDALSWVGYAATTVTPANVYAANEQYNAARTADLSYGPFDRSFSVYIVYNPPPAPSVFADNFRAYAMFDGPFTMMMWNSAGWGPSNLGRVLTHETAHIFWACDEYYDQPSDTGCTTCNHCLYNVGPRNVLATPWIRNANCNYPSSSCDVSTACMMKDLSASLCTHTPGQVGW